MKQLRQAIVILFAVSMAIPSTTIAREPAVQPAQSFTPDEIRRAFAASHNGYSSDELIVDETLRLAFMSELGIDASDPRTTDSQTRAALELLRLRKTGKLDVETTRSRREDLSPVTETAEIAVRTVLDRHQVTIDQVLCDPNLRNELQHEAEKIRPNVEARLIRKAVLRLRKIRRLRPELVLRVAQWDTEVRTMPVLNLDWDRIPESPGVYLFRDQSGYLYIGEASDLRERLTQHWSGSHNEGLAGVLTGESPSEESVTLELHVFADDSPGRQAAMRRAYESELIRSRQPRFNLRP
ncbi:GIY-YIG nuclease family protein [Neorhodopirellula pilleata]|uniref:GIY-YIG domain-containing protein n=1 Tax=Neorhodopirellula pilleata TaxID=2714738 RepID=A0A5C6ABH4_9BACT|nr:GIY-YIG nuclease family protein [Neorhodopirellula pilleata]TWT97402.1 hypothetical protein Pla100_25540 [Neorhodopirellula pilleata]